MAFDSNKTAELAMAYAERAVQNTANIPANADKHVELAKVFALLAIHAELKNLRQ